MRRRIIENVLAAAFSIGSLAVIVTLFYSRNLLTLILLSVVFLPIYLFWRDFRELVIVVPAAFLATSIEVVCVMAGAWNYANPDLLGVPLWLPVGWMHVLYSLNKLSELYHSEEFSYIWEKY